MSLQNEESEKMEGKPEFLTALCEKNRRLILQNNLRTDIM